MEKFLNSVTNSVYLLSKANPSKKLLKMEVSVKDATYVVEIKKIR